jgi:hypothetical protein
MLAEPTRSSGPEEALRQVATKILGSYRCFLSELRLEIVEGGVVIRGRAGCFYGKQIAFHEVSRRCGCVVVANEIEVQPRPAR